MEEGLEGAGCGRARCSPSCLAGAVEGDARVRRLGVRSPAPALAGGVCAPARAEAAVLWGAPRAFGASVCESKQAVKESSRGTQTYFCPGNRSLCELPRVSAGTWEWSVQVECWLDSASEVAPSPGDFHTSFRVCGCGWCVWVGGLQGPLLGFSYFKCSVRESSLSPSFLKVSEHNVGVFLGLRELFI